MVSQAETSFYLPDTIRKWPWKPDISPHYHLAKAESVAWIESFKPFSPDAQLAFNKCNFSLLAAFTYTKSDFYNFRSCCDLMHALFVLDEHTDEMDAAGTRGVCDAAMDAMIDPDKPRPRGENMIGEIFRQFWQRARRRATKHAQEHFITSCRKYFDSVVLQSDRRAKAYICTIDEYLATRGDNGGSDTCTAFLEICLNLDIPNEVMDHPAIASLTSYTAYLIALCNDLYSYKREVLNNNADYNAITILMINNNTDLAGALQWVSNKLDEYIDKFLKTRADILDHKNGVPSRGEIIDRDVSAYIDGLGQWIRANDDWHFSSGRYFGEEGSEIQKSRKVIIS